MKKQLINLMMTLAIVCGLSVNAWAQTTVPGADAQTVGSPQNPIVLLNGGTGTLQITKGYASSTVAWALYKGSDATTGATHTDDPINNVADLDIRPDATWTVTQNDNGTDATSTFYYKWTDQAAGSYYIEATETASAANGGCSTVRGYHIFIFGFDIEVYASLEDGTRITAPEDLADCGDDDYNVFMNDLVMDVTGTQRIDMFNSGTTPIPTNGDLTGAYGNQKTRRWYTAEIHFDGRPDGTGTTGTFDPTTLGIGSATMDILINGTNVTPVHVMNINNSGTDLAEDVASVTTTVVNSTTTTFTFPVDFADRWNTNLEPVATVTNFTLYPQANAQGTALGEEPVSKEDTDSSTAFYDNISNSFTIYGKPATSRITAN